MRRRFSSRRVVHEGVTWSNVCCAIGSLLTFFLDCLSGAIQKLAVTGLPHASTNRDGDLDIDVTLDCIRVGTDGVRALYKLSCRCPVDAGDGHGERGGQHERTRVVAAEADLGDNFDVAIGEMAASLAAHVKERVLKARGIAAGEELLWVGGIAFTSEGFGQGQLKIEQAVVAADRSMTAPGRTDFCGIDIIGHSFSPLSRRRMVRTVSPSILWSL